jgi:CRP/FNR family transcriptional regulator, cyclic AMP receptor protein
MNLSSCYLFAGLSQSQLEYLSGIATSISVKKSSWLFHRGAPADCLYTVEKGAVELLIEVQPGIEIPINMIRPLNGCVGASALVEPYRYSLSARCVEDGTLSVIRRADLTPLIEQHPHLGRILMTNLSRHLLERLNETRQEVQLRFMSLVRSATF